MTKLEMIKYSRTTATKGMKDAPKTLTVTDFGCMDSGDAHILYVKDEDNNVFATNSKSFIESFLLTIDALDEARAPRIIEIEKQKSRAGREYLMAIPAID